MNPDNNLLGVLVCFLSVLAVLWQGLASLEKGYGKSFLYHGGMWGDIFILSPLLGWIVANYGIDAWTKHEWIGALLICTAISYIMGKIWAKDPTPSSHTANGHQTEAGIVHLIYIVPSLSLIGLFYFFTPENVSVNTVWIITGLLIFHIMCGTHIVLGLLINFCIVEPGPDNKRYLEDKNAWATFIIVTLALTWRAIVISRHHPV